MKTPTKATLPTRPTQATALLIGLSALVMSGFTGGSCGPVDPPHPLPEPEPPVACERLAEDACGARGDCTAVYEQACACPACDPEIGECFPCDCPEPGFVSCHPNDPCAGLGEAACDADPFCEPVFVVPGCPEITCEPGTDCDLPVCISEPQFYECVPPPPTCAPVACRLYCEFGFATGPDGCEVCACNEPPPPPVCEPVLCDLYCEDGFITDERGCEICACDEPPPPPVCEPVLCELYCEFGFATDDRGCEICACNPPPPSRCAGLPEDTCAAVDACTPRYTFDECGPACDDPERDCPAVCIPTYTFEGCFDASLGCADDADCRGGYCEHYATCAGLDCPPPPPSMCVYAVCDDGSNVVCDIVPPTCAPGRTLAVRNGCFDCVDARTCR